MIATAIKDALSYVPLPSRISFRAALRNQLRHPKSDNHDGGGYALPALPNRQKPRRCSICPSGKKSEHFLPEQDVGHNAQQ